MGNIINIIARVQSAPIKYNIYIIMTPARALCRLKSSNELIFANNVFRADNACYNDIYMCVCVCIIRAINIKSREGFVSGRFDAAVVLFVPSTAATASNDRTDPINFSTTIFFFFYVPAVHYNITPVELKNCEIRCDSAVFSS